MCALFSAEGQKQRRKALILVLPQKFNKFDEVEAFGIWFCEPASLKGYNSLCRLKYAK